MNGGSALFGVLAVLFLISFGAAVAVAILIAAVVASVVYWIARAYYHVTR